MMPALTEQRPVARSLLLALSVALLPSAAAAQSDVPSAPGKPSATAGNESASLTWTMDNAAGQGVSRWQYVAIGNLGDPANWTNIPNSGVDTTSYTVTGLTNGTSYRFRVRAMNSLGAGVGSDQSDPVTPATTPPAPGKPTATAGDQTVNLSWSSNGNGGSALVRWEYAKSAWSGDYGSWTTAVESSVTVTGLQNGVPYRFKVRGVNIVGNGAESPESDAVTPLAPARPPAPTKPAATAGDESVSLSWSSNGSGDSPILHWDYLQSHRNSQGNWVVGTWAQIPGSGPNTTSFTVTGLTNGTTYQFSVRATSLVGAGASSQSDAVTPGPKTPAAPDKPGVTAGPRSVALSWSSNGNGGSAITGWKYASSEDGGSFGAWTAIPGSGAGTTSYTVTGLSESTSYRFKVLAANSVGDGAESPESDAVTPLAPATPPAPAKPAATRGDQSVTLSWSSNGDGGAAITRWEYVKNENGGSFETSWTRMSGSGAGTRSHTVTGLTNGTSYQFKVRAVNSAGDGAASPASDAVTPATTPPAPGKPTVASGDQSVTLGWSSTGNGGSAITGWQYTKNENGGSFETAWTAIPNKRRKHDELHRDRPERKHVVPVQGARREQPRQRRRVARLRRRAAGAGAGQARGAGGDGGRRARELHVDRPERQRHSDYGLRRPVPVLERRRLGRLDTGRPGGGRCNLVGDRRPRQRNALPGAVPGRQRAPGRALVGPGEGTPSGVPARPAAPTVTAGSASGTLDVSWTAPFDGGSPITGYSLRFKKCSGNCSGSTAAWTARPPP